jgi:hypothetical protein
MPTKINSAFRSSGTFFGKFVGDLAISVSLEGRTVQSKSG